MRAKNYATPIGLFCSLTAMSSCGAPTGESATTSASTAQQIQGSSEAGDSLFVSSNGASGFSTLNNVQRFDSTTGAYQGTFATALPEGNDLPWRLNGLIFTNPPNLLVIFQNPTPLSLVTDCSVGICGEALRFDAKTGQEEPPLVPHTDLHAPYGPDGVILAGNQVIIADKGDWQTSPEIQGYLRVYDKISGQHLYDFEPRPGDALEPVFHPRGVVIGPDGLVYAATRATGNGVLNLSTTGTVSRFDLRTHKFVDDFVRSDTCDCVFHHPEGLTFGPDGNLYVTSFPANPSEGDQIDVFSGDTGSYLRAIPTDRVGCTSTPSSGPAVPEAVVFGPDGSLFASIIYGGASGLNGEIRRYDPSLGTCTVFSPVGSVLNNPTYLTFGKTNPTTLSYPGNGH